MIHRLAISYIKRFVLPLLILSSLAVKILFVKTNDAEANGAVWNPGTVVGSLGPIKQSNLILSREHVIFYDDYYEKKQRVHATFWIYNPTQRNIAATMGFPIDYSEAMAKWGEQSGKQYEKYFAKEFRVSVDGEKVLAKSSKDYHGVYSLVFLWDMTFPAKKAVEMLVEYPLMASSKGEDGEDSSFYKETFRYITHTGAYWAKPIQQATFEYCDEYFISTILESPSGKASKAEDFEQTSWREETWWVKPKPYVVNKENKCIVWKRSNWTPVKDDDIEVGKTIRTYSTTASPFLPSAYLERWCSGGEVSSYKQFGEIVDIRTTMFTEDYFNSIQKKAFFFPDSAESSGSASVNVSLSMDIQTLLLRYLRNYIYAVHGHQFKDQQLAACFNNVKTDDNWTAVEKSNVDVILHLEKKLKNVK